MDTLARLNEVFRDTFEDEDLTVGRDTTAKNVAAWDSVMHITLMMSVERAFKLRFSSGEVANLKNVGALVDLIDSKKKA